VERQVRILVALIIFAASAFAQPPLAPARVMELGRKYTSALYANDTALLWSVMTDRMKDSLKDEPSLKEFNDRARAQLGKEVRVIREVALPSGEYLIYTRLAEFDKVQPHIVVQFTFGSKGEVAGFFVTAEQNAAATQYLDYKDKTAFRLPVTGEWTVYQGGRTVFDNYHAQSIDQRFAYDLLVIKNNREYENKGWELKDFYSYGLPVLAPAGGKVVAAVDQYDDNSPLKPAKDVPAHGNTIVIDHGNGEFSMLAHLQRGSVKVKPGDKVTAGQQVALCGNSGNSPIPHLHYHVQNSPVWFKGEGLPIQFHDYISNGKPVASGEPARGEVLQKK
jgi:murein DD-endopeptidase MepM/ murein hydrolase activator NlpD